jgi:predicted TIM-barrel fold metal-dependent hydrolase
MTTIYDAVGRGAPLDFTPFIDVHGHFGTWMETAVPNALDAARLIAEMDRWGCDQVWMTASEPGFGAPMRDQNDTVFGLAQAHPDRILPYCTLSANEPDQCLAELRRCLEYPRCIGVKMHRCDQPAYTLKSDFLRPVLELLNERRLVYMNHAYLNLADLDWALERYPDLTFINGHMAHNLMERAGRFANFYVCTCAAMLPDEMGGVVRRAGSSDKLLVGSDFNLFCLAFGPGMLAYSSMSENDQRNILGRNALRILDRQAWWSASLLRSTRFP